MSAPDAPSLSVSAAHEIAMSLLAAERVPPESLAFLRELRARSRDLLWTERPNGHTSVESFIEALSIVGHLAERLPATDFDTVLELLGHGWRALSAALLWRTGEYLAENQDKRLARLCALHVAAWFRTTKPAVDILAVASFQELIDMALNWQMNDEIELSRNPSTWSNPCPGVRIAGFFLEPVTSTTQLLSVAGTSADALCRVQRRDAMMAGLEAWWFAHSEFSAACPGSLGLERGDAQAEWDLCRDPAPRDDLRRVAEMVCAQAQTAVLRARTKKLIGAFENQSMIGIAISTVGSLFVEKNSGRR